MNWNRWAISFFLFSISQISLKLAPLSATHPMPHARKRTTASFHQRRANLSLGKKRLRSRSGRTRRPQSAGVWGPGENHAICRAHGELFIGGGALRNAPALGLCSPQRFRPKCHSRSGSKADSLRSNGTAPLPALRGRPRQTRHLAPAFNYEWHMRLRSGGLFVFWGFFCA